MRVHPYRLIGERLERLLKDELEPLIADWADQWLPEETAFTFERVIPLCDYFQNKRFVQVYKLVSWVDDSWCAILKPVESGFFGAMLVAAELEQMEELSSSTLLQSAAQQALIELAQRMLSGTRASHDNVPFFVTDNPYPAGAEHRGSGAIVVSFTVGSLAFDYIISPVTLERYIENMEKPVTEARPRLVPMPAALGNQKIRASVSLGSAELSLGELATIRVGDVVTLDRLVDQPASMRFGTDCHGCRGFIGVKDGALAFRVSRTEK